MKNPRCVALALAALLVTLTGCNVNKPSGFELVRVIEVAGRQGVATDGKAYYVSGSKALYTYSKEGELLNKNEDPFAQLDKPANHFGDISEHDGELYTGIEWFEDGRGRDIQIAVYDAKTLAFKRSFPWNPASGQVEVSAIAVDEPNGLVWMTDWVQGDYLYKYRLSDGAYAGRLHLWPSPQWQQGIAEYKGWLYITADDGDADAKEHDNLYRVRPEPGATGGFVRHRVTLDKVRDFGEIEGIDFDEDAKQMVVLSNRGKRIDRGTPKGLYPGYTREISELYVYKIMADQDRAPSTFIDRRKYAQSINEKWPRSPQGPATTASAR